MLYNICTTHKNSLTQSKSGQVHIANFLKVLEAAVAAK